MIDPHGRLEQPADNDHHDACTDSDEDECICDRIEELLTDRYTGPDTWQEWEMEQQDIHDA